MPSAAYYLQNAYNYTFSNNNVLECGACYLGDETLELRQSNNCYYIEANPVDYNVMCTQPSVLHNNVFNFALSDKIGDTSFTITSHAGNSSIKHCAEHQNELVTHFNSSFKEITIPCVTYPHFIRHIIHNPIDILILDIEGHEEVVLKTMKDLNMNELPKFLVIECGYNWPERLALCKDLGYTLDFYQYNNAYLTHSSADISKHNHIINSINNENREFIWQGKYVYKNDLPLLP